MKEKVIKNIFPAFGTVNTVTIYDDYDIDILKHIKWRMLQLHNRFSFFDVNSEIYKINQQAGIKPIYVSKDTIYLLSLALDYAKDTNGTFDVTIGAMSELWKNAIRSTMIPFETEIKRCKKLCNIKKLKLDNTNGTVFLSKKGMKLDFGGIVKGYAADETRRILKEYGVQNAQINFGGTVVVIGKKQKVGIQNPFKSTGNTMASIVLENKAIVTSGSYEQYFSNQGKIFHHIVNPYTGRPSCSRLLSVTLIGDEATKLDAFATSICCLGQEKGTSIVRKHGISAIFVTDNGSVQITPDLKKHISFDL